jgi:hypothetical protein
MGQLSPTGFLPAGCHGLRFYLSSGKPMGRLSPMGFLPAGCHGTKLYRALWLSTVFLCRLEGLLVQREIHVAALILITLLDFYQRVAHCHGLMFYLSSGKPMGQLSPVGFLPAGCQWIEILPVQREAHWTAFTYRIFTSGLPWYEALQLSTWLPWYEALQLSTGLLCRLRGFTCPKRSPCGSFYLTSGLPIAMV